MSKKVFTSKILNQFENVMHGFGMAGFSVEDLVACENNPVVHKTHQIHSDVVHVLNNTSSTHVLNGDAFVTFHSDVVCAVRTADCVPILITDSKSKVVGAIHAGWRGTMANIAGVTINKLKNEFDIDPKKVCAAIGPAICKKCYEVGEDVITCFEDKHLENRFEQTRDEKFLLDIRGINYDQLIAVGLLADNVEFLDECTFCNPESLASFRRDQTNIRQVSYIFKRQVKG